MKVRGPSFLKDLSSVNKLIETVLCVTFPFNFMISASATSFGTVRDDDGREDHVRRGLGPVSDDRVELPRIMRFCGGFCFSLTLENGHYVALQDGSRDGKVTSIYTVFHFSKQEINLKRNEPDGSWAELKGKISSSGNKIDEPIISWHHKGGQEFTGTYRLTWGSALWDAKPLSPNPPTSQRPDPPAGIAKGSIADLAYQATMHELAKSNVILPKGASPAFAAFPAEVRAVLLPEYAIIPTHIKLSCDSSLSIAARISAIEAVEIGKAALRAADLIRGYCWIKRADQMGSRRAHVLLGVASGMSWGETVDKKSPFQYFLEAVRGMTARTMDPWAVYFLQECYSSGGDAPKDGIKAFNLLTNLNNRPEGRQVLNSVGADDLEGQRMLERANLMLDPPLKEVVHCLEGLPGNPCSTETVVDDDKLQKELRTPQQ
jgi:hypothetical protein